MKRILVVDDDRDIRELLFAMLCDAGYEVVLADGGEAAIDAYAKVRHSELHFELVILDLAMPYTNGFEVAERIRTAGDKDIRILFMTGYEDGESLQKQASTLSRSKIVHKPFVVEDILSRVQEILRLADEEQQGNRPP